MPGTTDGLSDREPIGKWSVVVSAVGPYREYLLPAVHE
jgi:short subunit dehydrogenase-like uncharacterized protein